ncbi:FtsX-like permease family protein [Actinoplanes sp. LDG1-06]|uniref:FtsX-like permease family protein n=1 Tax=Paractinoplanes ovalisporus TaxID=2810368 RepID=A0ABS2A6W1_9ACTN|nr:FtsX-like permease family protein [Actinoplanes ovalisporus]MBM2615582.1 FtsX-like permease family protein [Actinoplanes ovalisporus]
MSALGTVIRSGVRRRRVQTIVIGLVAAAAVTAAVLGAGLLVASRAPFDQAFAAQRGAHLTVQLTTAQQATVPTATATAGPYAVMNVPFHGPEGMRMPDLTVVARPGPGGDVDRVELTDGRWATAPDEIVIGGDMFRVPTGFELTTDDGHVFTVVGTARSVSGTASAWVLPSAVDRLGGATGYQMLYRFAAAGTPAEVEADRAAVEAALPPGSVLGARSWLDVRERAVREAAVFVPFLVAFALLGIVMAVLVVGTVIAGTVGAATRRIGILKALGCTPAGIVRAFVIQALLPATVGAVAGAVAGNLIALPVLAETEQLYGSANMTIAWWVTLVAAGGVLTVVAATAWAAALRAGRLRTVDAIAVGRASSPVRGRWAGRLAARLPVPRPVALGLARPFARPVRTTAILLAVATGAAAVTFATGLAASLVRIQGAVEQNNADVTVEAAAPSQQAGPGEQSQAQDWRVVPAAIGAQPGTRAFYGVAQAPVTAPGLSDPMTVTAFTGDATWDGYLMVSGRWFTAPGEAVAGAPFLKAMGARVGDTVTVRADGEPVRLHIVGEVFETGSGVFISAATIPDMPPGEWRIALTDGTDASAYSEALNKKLGGGGPQAHPTGVEIDPLLAVVQGLTATLTLLLLAVAALGLLNMLVLDLRDRVHDLGVHKALGMTPRQTIAMVVASVIGVGLLGGALGVPAGIALQRLVVPAMAASGGLHLPDSLLDVYGPVLLAALALGGPAIALLGALMPAGWAARIRTAAALRTE